MKSKRLPGTNTIQRSYGTRAIRIRTRPFINAALLILCLGLCLTWPEVVRASTGGLAAEQMSVRELMRIETDLALNQARKTLRKDDKRIEDMEGDGRISRSGPLKLVGIYGVGKKLLAEVEIGAQPHVYMRGHAFPVGMKASPSSYKLLGISGSCVQLERKDEAHTLCLPHTTWR